MSELGERQALLSPDTHSEGTLQYRLPNREGDSRSDEDSCQSEEWWSDSSSCSSSCDSDICSVADWQSEVNTLGELMYIESLISEVNLNGCSKKNNETHCHREQTDNKIKTKMVSQNKLIRLIRRRNSGSRRSTRRKLADVKGDVNTGIQLSDIADHHSLVNSQNIPGNRVTLSVWPETELRAIPLRVFGENLGRRASLSESLLGLVISTFSDKSNILIADFVPNTEAAKHLDIKIGDWLYSINGHLVTISNIDSVLKTIVPPVEITLGLQRRSSLNSNTADRSSEQGLPRHQSELVRSLLCSNNAIKLLESNKSCLFSVMYISCEDVNAEDEEIPPDQGIVYCFPTSPELNILHKMRGAFITLHCLMKDAVLSQHTPSHPVSSSFYYNGNLINVIYYSENQELLLLCVPNEKCTLIDAEKLTAEIVQCLIFKYQSLSRCFKYKEHIPLLEQFFSVIFTRLYSPSWFDTSHQIGQLFLAAHWIPLPHDAQMQIDDALSELEANDLGSFVNNNQGCQRLYSVIGTCLYHKGYLLSSHLARQDLVSVNSWCNQRGLLHLTRVERLSSLVTWHEVYPASCNRGLLSNVNTNAAAADSTTNSSFPCPPNARWFLLIVGQGNSLLVVLLEAGGCSVEAIGVVGPDIYYVQQAQATLSHIHKIGVPSCADKWLCNAVRPQVITPDYDYCNKTSTKRTSADNSSNISLQSKETSKSCDNISQSKLSLSNVITNSNKMVSTSSLSSIIKHRNSPDNSVNIISTQQQNLLHKNTCPDEVSEGSTRSSVVSDEVAPILGRRAEREKERERAATTSDTNSHSRLSDSDFSDDSDWEPRRILYGSRSLDMLLDFNKTKFSTAISIIPSSLLAGKQNSLFHFVQLDQWEGVILGPPSLNSSTGPLMNVILDKFNASVQSIHLLLKNTVQFKKLNAQEVHESLINKSLVAIKEYGMLFETDLEQYKKSSATALNFWVVGRLFFTPHAKEVYICYEESAPQNMVEIAFRLALSTSG